MKRFVVGVLIAALGAMVAWDGLDWLQTWINGQSVNWNVLDRIDGQSVNWNALDRAVREEVITVEQAERLKGMGYGWSG